MFGFSVLQCPGANWQTHGTQGELEGSKETDLYRGPSSCHSYGMPSLLIIFDPVQQGKLHTVYR